MTAMNQRLNADIETVFLMADPHRPAVVSRLVKEVARLDGTIDTFVSPAVAGPVEAKVKGWSAPGTSPPSPQVPVASRHADTVGRS